MCSLVFCRNMYGLLKCGCGLVFRRKIGIHWDRY